RAHYILFFFHSHRHHRALHSFPTRRSSDLVESPAKARTISKYLGRGYAVMASVGHVKDLPENKLGVDIQRNFTPQYVTIKGKTQDRKSTRLNSSHLVISYAVFCLKKKNKKQ